MDSIFQLQEVHNVPKQILDSAKAQIGSGLVLLGITVGIPVLLPFYGPIAGLLISEGITDILMSLLDQAQQSITKLNISREN